MSQKNTTSRAPCLLFCSTNDIDAIKRWYDATHCDLAVTYYGESEEDFEFLQSLKLSFLKRRQGLKIDNFKTLLDEHPEVLEYDYILFADDDIRIECKALDTFIQKVIDLNVAMAQPSLHWNSYGQDYPHLLHLPLLDYQFVQFIETAFFVVQSRYISETLHLWQPIQSGYGLDIILSVWLNRKKLPIALIHSVSMIHPIRLAGESVRSLDSRKKQIQKIHEHISVNMQLSEASIQTLLRKPEIYTSVFRGGIPCPSSFFSLGNVLKQCILRSGLQTYFSIRYAIQCIASKAKVQTQSQPGFFQWRILRSRFSTPEGYPHGHFSYSLYQFIYKSLPRDCHLLFIGFDVAALHFLKSGFHVSCLDHRSDIHETIKKDEALSPFLHRLTFLTISETPEEGMPSPTEGDYLDYLLDRLPELQDEGYMLIALTSSIPLSFLESILMKLEPGGFLLKECPSTKSLKEVESKLPQQEGETLFLGAGQAVIDAYTASLVYLHYMYKSPEKKRQ